VGALVGNIGALAHGLLLTAGMAVGGTVGALLLGTLLAVFRISPVWPLRAFGAVYVTVFRNVPLLMLLVLFAFGLPDIGLLFSLFGTATLAMLMYWAAFVCEVVRAGVRAVPRGQIEAARALGFGFGQVLGYVVLPQAIRSMVQPLANIVIAVTLSTALSAAVGVTELTGQAQFLTIQYDIPIPAFALTTLIYVAITLTAGLVAGRIERKWAISR
jgi:glutamate transport system permease protein